MDLGHNTVAALITRGLAEITRLVVACGGSAETMAGLAGLGDLVLTCTGGLSRNRSVGVELGRGRKLDDIIAGMHGMVAEGVLTTNAAVGLAQKVGVEMPITEQMHAILQQGKVGAGRDTRPDEAAFYERSGLVQECVAEAVKLSKNVPIIFLTSSSGITVRSSMCSSVSPLAKIASEIPTAFADAGRSRPRPSITSCRIRTRGVHEPAIHRCQPRLNLGMANGEQLELQGQQAPAAIQATCPAGRIRSAFSFATASVSAST